MAWTRSLHTWLRPTVSAALLCLIGALADAQAQIRWMVDPKTSLAWWQMDPHLNHLWATTCPQEHSWQPGKGRSGGWSGDEPALAKFGSVSDTIHVPLYPRLRIRPVCTEAVEGEIITPDTITWHGARGHVAVSADALVTGDNIVDAYARHAVLQTTTYPQIRFAIDSIVDVIHEADTVRGTAVGILSLHGVTKPISVVVKAFPQAGGTRVLAKFHVSAPSLVSEFGLSREALGFGVKMNIWKDLFMGVDLLMHAEGTGAN